MKQHLFACAVGASPDKNSKEETKEVPKAKDFKEEIVG
jgi:DNA polymerase lambda